MNHKTGYNGKISQHREDKIVNETVFIFPLHYL